MVVVARICSLYFMKIMSLSLSFKRHLHCGNPFLFSGATAVQSRPKSHTFTVNLAMFAPQPRWRQKSWKGVLFAITRVQYVEARFHIFYLSRATNIVVHCTQDFVIIKVICFFEVPLYVLFSGVTKYVIL